MQKLMINLLISANYRQGGGIPHYHIRDLNSNGEDEQEQRLVSFRKD